jgi:hypothetical protein
MDLAEGGLDAPLAGVDDALRERPDLATMVIASGADDREPPPPAHPAHDHSTG